ncbi:putative chemotaxis response regulator [Calothrix sp. NIES-2100]|uniref:ATP-binding response regulator n=1 Tax=Calothrix sp. NIES-2100 TaxID=1954172 RepID=UPI000B608402|nr:putative chemotaxis response regulator [Calothrix sp. NIES-2100]
MVLDFGIKNSINQKFVQEALGLLQQIHNGLLELPHNYTAAKMRTLVRITQLIKDAADQVDLTDIQTLAYRLEKIFRFLSLENNVLNTDMTALLIEANEYLGILILAQINGKSDDAVNVLAKAESVFAHLESRNHNQQVAVNSAPTTNLKTDRSGLIPTTEVTQALNNLEMILTQSPADNLVEKLKLAANVFLDFGDRLKISEFVAIAQVTLTTLQASPKAAQMIGQIALTGWRAAYEAIFNQDVSQQMTPQLATPKHNHSPTLPLTGKTANLFVWLTDNTVFTVNSNHVVEILVAEADEIIYSQQKLFLHWQGKIIPTYQLSRLLKCANSAVATSELALPEFSSQNLQPEPTLILSLGQQIFALQPEIESLIAESELVIQPLESSVKVNSHVYGSTTWKDRQLQVIDVAALLSETIDQRPEIPATAKLLDAPNTAIFSKKPTILVVDDSKSVRHLVSLALQKFGYKVLHAEDGQEAIAQLQQNSDIQLVICDVEMPNMNGFEFLTYRHKDPLLAQIPVIMLSTCSTNQHRMLAMQLGAANYFTKPYVEQEFIGALKLILSQKSYC